MQSRRWLLLALPRLALVAAVRAVTGIDLEASGGAPCGDADRETLAAREQEKLEGAWVGVSQEADGRETPANTRVVLTAGNSVATDEAGAVIFCCTWRVIDATATPMHVDLVTPDGQVFQAVYQMQGNTLTYCGSYTNRPPGFSTKEGDGRYRATLRRATT